MKSPALIAITVLAIALTACGKPEEENTNSCGPTEATIYRVIDGDTIVLDTAEQETIRFLLVDTPETVNLPKDQKDPDCYGPEAKKFTQSLLQMGEKVKLEYDQECTDIYGKRLLAYVWYNGTMVNKTLVERGYAKFYPFNNKIPYKYYDELQTAENEARAAKRGGWGECAGDKWWK